jgi:hypothetical protein
MSSKAFNDSAINGEVHVMRFATMKYFSPPKLEDEVIKRQI